MRHSIQLIRTNSGTSTKPAPQSRRGIFGLFVTAPTLAFLLLATATGFGGSATWSDNPVTNNWNTPTNWNPNTVPNGLSDIASFGFSHTTGVVVTTRTMVNSIAFEPSASAYTITASASQPMTIGGTGISNASGIEQHFQINPSAELDLTNSATVAPATVFDVQGGPTGGTGGFLVFSNSSSAGDATIVGRPSIGGVLASIRFVDSSTAGRAVITSQGISSVDQHFGGVVWFFGTSTAAESTITCEGASVPGGNLSGGLLYFVDKNSSAGTATITANGGSGSGTIGAFVQFLSGSTASSTLIANGGTDGGEGGEIVNGGGNVVAGRARVELFGNGNFNQISSSTIGSVEGDGLLYLGGNNLTVGNNGLNTVFSGIIQDGGFSQSEGGSLAKTGAGTLTLTGANLYTGGTTVNQGKLVIDNQSGSGTGTEVVSVSAGTLGGGGTISGVVIVGTGNGTRAFLAPAAGTKKQATLTVQGGVILQADATYICTARAKGSSARGDKVVANGVTINGAAFSFRPKVQGALQAGLVFKAIENTSANPISGTFSNLADGAIVTINGNNLQASYSGGDGNDLTLTVVP
jgi:autotransporter-associated beta strand protein